MLKQMRDRVCHWYFAAPQTQRALSPRDLAQQAEQLGISEFESFDCVAQACKQARKRIAAGDYLVVFGSVFVVAEAQQALQESGNK